MEQITKYIADLSFYQTATLTLGILLANFIVDIIACLRSGQKIKTCIIQEVLNKKITNFFYYFIVGFAFHFSSLNGTEVISTALNKIGTFIVLIPAIPEILGIYDKLKAIKAGDVTTLNNKAEE